MDDSIHRLLASALAELGLSAPADLIQTMLMHDGYFAGWKLRYDSGHALLPAGSNTLELYDERGQMLKAVALEAKKDAA
jgi:hypothetical protein